jgi:hypothetical protein
MAGRYRILSCLFLHQSPNFQTFNEPKNRFYGTKSAWLFSLAGPYDNPIPTRFLGPIDCLKIPALLIVPEKSIPLGGRHTGV